MVRDATKLRSVQGLGVGAGLEELEALFRHEGGGLGAPEEIEEEPWLDDEEVGEEGVEGLAVAREGEGGGGAEVGLAAVGVGLEHTLEGGGGVREALFLQEALGVGHPGVRSRVGIGDGEFELVE